MKCLHFNKKIFFFEGVTLKLIKTLIQYVVYYT